MTGDPTPLPIPIDSAHRLAFILLFGGSFDPPHRAHIDLPALVRDELERRSSAHNRGWLIYVPAARSPHKHAGPIAPDADRMAMLNLATQSVPRAGIWTDEIDRSNAVVEQPSYTVDTLGRARRWMDEHDLSGVPLFLLIGADQAANFHRWRDPRDILRLAKPVVMIRGEQSDAQSLSRALEHAGFWNANELAMWSDALVNVGRMDVSSTDVRAAIANRDDIAMSRFLLPQVADYIRTRGLYTRK